MLTNKPHDLDKIQIEEEHHLAHSDLCFYTKYPEKNPGNALDDITNVLDHLGLFDHLKEKALQLAT